MDGWKGGEVRPDQATYQQSIQLSLIGVKDVHFERVDKHGRLVELGFQQAVPFEQTWLEKRAN